MGPAQSVEGAARTAGPARGSSGRFAAREVKNVNAPAVDWPFLTCLHASLPYDQSVDVGR